MNALTFTADQIRENFPTSLTDEDRAKVYDSLSSSVSHDEAEELFVTITNTLEQKAKDGKVPDYSSWNRYDKLLWAVKEAYVFGQIAGMELTMGVNQMGMDFLLGEGASGRPSK